MWASHDEPPNVGDSTNAETTSTAGFANRRVEPCPARGERPGERRPVEADRAVRFDEHDIHVRALDTREVGSHRRAGGQRPRSRNCLCDEPDLPRIGEDDGRGERVYR